LPSAGLRGVRESNVLGLLGFDSDLVHALDAAAPEVRRAVALLAARRACEISGLAAMAWVAPALAALAEGRPLPPPFDDRERMREALRSDPPVPGPTVFAATPPERPPYRPPTPAAAAGLKSAPAAEAGEDDRKWAPPVDAGRDRAVVRIGTPYVPGPISPPHFALPAVLAAADPTPLKAAVNAVWHALHTYGEHYPELLEEVWSACREPGPVLPDEGTGKR